MHEGMLLKMPAEALRADGGAIAKVNYRMWLSGKEVPMAAHIGKPFGLHATGALSCVVCGRVVKKHYGQGMCFPCLRDAPEASECIIRPELCRGHLGEGRDPAWEAEHHAVPHVLYLSHTGGVKVGVTRASQVPVRWVDQGATAAVVVARTPHRALAGRMEVALKAHLKDRTDWRAMLRDTPPDADALLAMRDRLSGWLPDELREHLVRDEEPMLITYPVEDWPTKVTSVQLARTPLVEGTLVGIKGQYLIWSDGRVLNVRNHAGCHVVVG